MTEYLEPKPSGLNKASVEQIAQRVAGAFGITVGQQLEPVVTQLGGTITYGWNDVAEIEGGSIEARSMNDFVIRISELTSPVRDRFTIAHELGHLFLHLPQIKKIDSAKGMRATRYLEEGNSELQRAEWEANWFSAGLLMPRAQFTEYVTKYGISATADLFNVSQSAATVRARALGLV